LEAPVSGNHALVGSDQASRWSWQIFVATLVVLAVAIVGLAAWYGRSVLLLLFLAYALAAAMRPGIEVTKRHGLPASVAIVIQAGLLLGTIALLLWLFVPAALAQMQAAADATASPARADDGGLLGAVQRQAVLGAEHRLGSLPSIGGAVSAVLGALGVLAGIAFTLACAFYWVFERDRALELVLRLVPEPKRNTIRDSWLLIELKVGAVMRTKLVLVAMSASALSVVFWLIGLPYFLVLGTFAGVVEIIPVIGPLAAALAAIATGLTVSWHLAVAAGCAVVGLRLVQDYVVSPRLFGHAAHLPPLVVLVVVSAVALLLGPFWVPLAIPLAATFATLLDVVVRDRDPGAEQVPTALLRVDDTVAERYG
jgi:predicted PurR-regulated permease PerM